MNGQSRGRRGNLEAREAWTARLNRYANARTVKQRDAALNSELKINPGGTIRDLLQAWGYSASERGRKAKGTYEKGTAKPARERLELTLDELFGKMPTPVPSLNPKLAGRTDITVKDAWRIVAALLISWPEKLSALEAAGTKDKAAKALNLAETFVRDLLGELSAGQSQEWTVDDMEVLAFRLVNEKRVRVVSFVHEAGEKEGALIVAGARNILIGTHPTEILRVFHQLTRQFIDEGHQGILIFVFDTAIFEAGEEGFNLLYNIGLLSTAMTAFALFPENYEYRYPIQQHQVDWSHWRILSTRCCVVIRKPPLIDPVSGTLLKREKLDDFIADWRPEQKFARLDELKGFVRFDSGHVLPRTYPTELGDAETLGGQDLYWDVLVRPSGHEPDGLEVQYFIPPLQRISATAESQEGNFKNREVRSSSQRRRGRPAVKTKSIEGDFYYVTKRASPGPYYDDAQRAIYLAARGRLDLDNGENHTRNLNAAAALRQIGYEVLPISIMLSLFPRALHFAAAMQRIPEKTHVK